MEKQRKQKTNVTGTWHDEQVKALLHFPRFPIRLIQQEPWQSWIGERGGLSAVIAYLQAYPFSPSHRRFLDVILDTPEAVAEVYADRLNISRATYFYQLRGFISALVQALNHWEMEADAVGEKRPFPTYHLPVPLTSLIGAEETLLTLTDIIRREEVRLLTLLGPGGIGKTRLSIELAHQLEGDACFVDLSGLLDHGQVVVKIAQAVGAADDTLAGLNAWLHTQELMLILDNFEQLLPAKSVITAMLTNSPQLKIIVTSRTALHLYGEHQFVIPPLVMSDIETEKDPQRWAESPAMRLFVQRAQSVNTRFVLNEENVDAVAQVCMQTEGLPLAIELAAFQAKYYSPQAMTKRLFNNRCLDFFNQVPKRMPFHQQTLRGMFDWSYDLLPSNLQAIFCQLSVLKGGFSMETAETVCGVDNIQMGLMALVDHSLLEQQTDTEGEPRFQMHGFTREYACERLSAGLV